jgi:hypothetical protein
MLLGGVPAVLLVLALGPGPPDGPGLVVWAFAIMAIGWCATAVVYSVIQAFRTQR